MSVVLPNVGVVTQDECCADKAAQGWGSYLARKGCISCPNKNGTVLDRLGSSITMLQDGPQGKRRVVKKQTT